MPLGSHAEESLSVSADKRSAPDIHDAERR
jgi:hypothetical protein